MSASPKPEAYVFFQGAQQLRASGRLQHTRAIIDMCKRAIAVDPNYAQAWAQLAVNQTLLGFDAGPDEDGAEAADKALALDLDLAEGHAAKAGVLIGRGKAAEAKPEIERALQLDPESYDVNATAARYFIATKNYGDAIKHLTKAETLMETDVWAPGMALQCHEARGDNAGARMAAQHAMEKINKILKADPEHVDALGFGVTTLLRLGQGAKAQEWAEKALKLSPDSRNLRYNMACAMVQLARFDRALELLEPVAAACNRFGIEWIKIDTDLDPIRKGARFKHMLEDAEARLAAASPPAT
ncbi:MAG TPA: tetratricopeptide repeat protein [Burkholderiales bacterium]|nr:tetratricopeptide repeat protein [Burkholderiales bacterium]